MSYRIKRNRAGRITVLSLFVAHYATPDNNRYGARPRTGAIMASRMPFPVARCHNATGRAYDCHYGESAPFTLTLGPEERGGYIPGSYRTRTVRYHYCDECLTTCESCNEPALADDVSYVMGGGNWCESCRSDSAIYCEICNDYVVDSRAAYCDGCNESHCRSHMTACDCGELYCDDDARYECCPDSSDDDDGDFSPAHAPYGNLYGYSYKPYPLFKGEGPSYFGIELEVSVPSHYAATIHANYGDLLYCKSDSSVDGFEIVSHPMTYEYAMESFPWHILTDMDSIGSAGPNGLHIHVSRAAFGDEDHLARWNWLVNVNRAMWTHVSRRNSGDWAAWQPYATGRDSYGYPITGWIDHPTAGRSLPRYMALNWQNGATIECRTFASTLNPDELRAAIALMSASVEYTRTHECVGDSAFDSFAGWVFAHPSYGPALAATLYAYTQLDVAA